MSLDQIKTVLASQELPHAVDLLVSTEPPDGWDSAQDHASAAFDEAARLINEQLGQQPFHRGVGSLLSSITMPMTPEPARGLFISAWKTVDRVVYLVLTTHDADTRRCLNLEVHQRSDH